MRRRGLLKANVNPGLVNLSGAAGDGVAKAGNIMMNLGKQWNDDDVRIANEKAIELEKKEKYNAQSAYNSAINPELSKSIQKNNPNANLGLINLSAPPEKKSVSFEKQTTGEDGYLYNVFSDGSMKKTDVKAKDYQKPAAVKTNIPDGFMLGSDVNILHSSNDTLYGELADIGAFRRGKSGALYIDEAKYKSFLELKNKDIK